MCFPLGSVNIVVMSLLSPKDFQKLLSMALSPTGDGRPHVLYQSFPGSSLLIAVSVLLWHLALCYNYRVDRQKVRKVLLTSFADFLNGMATAWAFAAYDSIS